MPLTAFGQWVNSTRETLLTDPKYIVNEVSAQSYTLARLIDQGNAFRNVRAGKSIVERVKVLDQGTYTAYSPGQPRSPTRINPIRNIEYKWTFGESSVLYTDAEVELNEGGSEYEQFKSFRTGFRQDGITDHINGVEAALWAAPATATMVAPSGATAQVPMSIPCFVTEDEVRFRPPSTPWADSAAPSVAGIDPTTVTAWRNALVRYDSTQKADPYTGIIAGLDSLMVQLNFQSLGKAGDAFQFTNLGDLTIFTNRDGLNNVQALYRNAQDEYVTKKDAAYFGVMHNGVPVVYVSALDTAALEPNASTSASTYTGAYTTGKPRFFVINRKFLAPIWHPKNFMNEKEAIPGGITGRDTEAIFYVSWWLIACNSRRRQGLLAPL